MELRLERTFHHQLRSLKITSLMKMIGRNSIPLLNSLSLKLEISQYGMAKN